MKTKVVGGIVLKSQATAINLVILNISISPRCLENYRFNNRNMLCRILKYWKKSSFEPSKWEERRKGQTSLRSWYNLKGRRKQWESEILEKNRSQTAGFIDHDDWQLWRLSCLTSLRSYRVSCHCCVSTGRRRKFLGQKLHQSPQLHVPDHHQFCVSVLS